MKYKDACKTMQSTQLWFPDPRFPLTIKVPELSYVRLDEYNVELIKEWQQGR